MRIGEAIDSCSGRVHGFCGEEFEDDVACRRPQGPAQSIASPILISVVLEIAKEFGGDDSYRFINGLLGRVARDLDEQASGSGSDSDAHIVVLHLALSVHTV